MTEAAYYRRCADREALLGNDLVAACLREHARNLERPKPMPRKPRRIPPAWKIRRYIIAALCGIGFAAMAADAVMRIFR